MSPNEDTENSVANTAASEDIGTTLSTDMGGLGVGIGGTGGGYDPNFGAFDTATDLGMGAYTTSAIADFASGDSDRNYFAPPPVGDFSLTSQQNEFGYSIGTLGPNYGMVQQPESYGEGGARRVGLEEAQTYAGFLGTDISVIPGYSEKGTGFFGTVSNLVGKAMGTPRGVDFTIDPSQNFIGQVIDDRAMMDGIGNLISGLFSPVPGISIDTAVIKDIRAGQDTRETQMYAGDPIGSKGEVMTFAAFEEKSKNAGAPSGDGSASPLRSVVAKALSRVNVNLASMISQAEAPSIEPTEYGSSYIYPEYGQDMEMRYGGVAEKDDVQRMMDGGVATRSTVDIPDIVDLGGEVDKVRANPDSYFLDPNIAKTAGDLEAVYAYNKKVMDVANGKLRLPTPMQEGGEAVNGPVGFVDRPPEQLNPQETIADDVPMDVEEGTFIINGAAVEFAGSEDIKTMLLNAMKEAERQGVDISTGNNTISREDTVSLLVSKGEVVVPPALAKIIGYDRLEKINNRGKKEVQKRQAEAEAQQQPAQPQPAPTNPAEGTSMREGGIVF